MVNNKKRFGLIVDLLIIVGIILLSALIVIKFQADLMISTILFFLFPSVYLLLRKPKPLKRIFAASFLFGIVFAFLLSFLATINGAWLFQTNYPLFNYKVLEVMSVGELLWFFLWVFLITVFYEHFIETDRSDKLSHNFKYGLFPAFAATIGIVATYFVAPNFLKFDYAYFVLGCFTLLPFVFLAWMKPALLIKFAKVAPFFFFLYLTFELIALKLGQWSFPGRYIGSVELFSIKFPFEEFFFWILMSSTVVLSYYELYVDDKR